MREQHISILQWKEICRLLFQSIAEHHMYALMLLRSQGTSHAVFEKNPTVIISPRPVPMNTSFGLKSSKPKRCLWPTVTWQIGNQFFTIWSKFSTTSTQVWQVAFNKNTYNAYLFLDKNRQWKENCAVTLHILKLGQVLYWQKEILSWKVTMHLNCFNLPFIIT